MVIGKPFRLTYISSFASLVGRVVGLVREKNSLNSIQKKKKKAFAKRNIYSEKRNMATSTKKGRVAGENHFRTTFIFYFFATRSIICFKLCRPVYIVHHTEKTDNRSLIYPNLVVALRVDLRRLVKKKKKNMDVVISQCMTVVVKIQYGTTEKAWWLLLHGRKYGWTKELLLTATRQ